MLKQRAELTFKHNLKQGRHGWVRLTPAYSVQLVRDILAQNGSYAHVLDPFSGSGTTGLACAQADIDATLLDINPFLVWLARVKTANYKMAERTRAKELAPAIANCARQLAIDTGETGFWTPPIYNIKRWWSPNRLSALARIYQQLNEKCEPGPARDLFLIAFCRLLIDWSNAAFNHQSMSFRAPQAGLFDESDMIFSAFVDKAQQVANAAGEEISGAVQVLRCDARRLDIENGAKYDCVITSPPYANRMSYIRELRPYMYWLGYLSETSDAGELDWQAIGGTWGSATSRLKGWQPRRTYTSSHLQQVVAAIAKSSETLANYVHKYVEDMYLHFLNIRQHLTDGAELYYIVGNSKFYATVVSVEKLYAEMMAAVGLVDIDISPIRKRNSKKELYEYVVFARNIAE